MTCAMLLPWFVPIFVFSGPVSLSYGFVVMKRSSRAIPLRGARR